MEKSTIIAWSEKEGVIAFTPKKGWEKFELERGAGENVMRFSLVSRHLRWLQGEILTILEATIEDERRLKATKDLVKDKFSAKISWLYEQCGTPEEEQDGLVDPE